MTCEHSWHANGPMADRIQDPGSRIPVFVAALLIATLVFWAFTQTLLPGVDLGDTGGFQAAVLWPEVSARQAYPLYYGLAHPFVAVLSAINQDRKSTRLNSSHSSISYAVFCLKKKKNNDRTTSR